MSSILKFGTGWHSSIPNEFIQNPQNPPLGDGAFRLFIVIVSYASPSSPQPFPRWSTLCKNLSCCRHSLAKRLNDLESRGWIKREQCAGEQGRFGHNIYTICPDDSESIEKRKQFLSPSVTLPHSVQPHSVRPHSVKRHTKSTNDLKETKYRMNTITEEAADAANGVDVGICFLKRWCQGYREWFKIAYIQKHGEANQALKVIEELKCRPKDLLAYAFRMWINTTDFDETTSGGFDPLFYQIKGSRNLGFFLRHLSEIATEQKEPLDCAIPVKEPDYRELEEVISEGRP